MKDQTITFEVAKLAKEKGFNEKVPSAYDEVYILQSLDLEKEFDIIEVKEIVEIEERELEIKLLSKKFDIIDPNQFQEKLKNIDSIFVKSIDIRRYRYRTSDLFQTEITIVIKCL